MNIHHQTRRRILTSIAVVAIVFQSTGGLIPAFAASEPQVTDPQLTETDAINGERVDTAALAQTSSITPITPSTSVIPVQNPTLAQSCGLDIGLLVDSSGSIDGAEMTQMKSALSNFATAFNGTPTVFSLASFSTNSALNRPFSLTPSQAASDVSNYIPSLGNGWTNWDSGLAQSAASFDPRPAHSNLIVIATDGSPNRWGNPTNGTVNYSQAVDNAILSANTIKSSGTRIVVVGIGNDTEDPATPAEKLNKMKAISGTNVALLPADITVDTDVIKVTDFTGIGAALSSFATQLCGGKILVQKQFDTDGNGTVDLDGSTPNPLLAAWNFTVDAQTKTTTNTGALEFDTLNGTHNVIESAGASNTTLTAANCQNNGQTVGTVDLATKTISGLVTQTDQTISCTFVNAPLTGSLTVLKSVDTNGDGIVDITNDPTWTWDLDGGNQNFVTGSTQLVVAGVHSVNENNQPNYHNLSWSCVKTHDGTALGSGTGTTLSVNVPATGATCTFTNSRDIGRIAGVKFNDLNGDGERETGEPGFEGVTIRLSNSSSTVTDVNGNFAFELLPLGTYTVTEVVPAGWITTTPNPITGVVVKSNETSTVTFGNFQLGKISGFKFDSNHAALNGWRICITPQSDDSAVRVVTGEDNCVTTGAGEWPTGYYEFTDLSAGTYRVYETLQPGWENVSPALYGHVVTITCGTGLGNEHASYDFINRQLVPDLAVTKTDGLTTANTGQQVTYTIVASNRGETSAENVTVVDTLPAHVAFVSASDSGVYNTTTRTISWNLGTMENTGPTQSKTLTVTVLLDALFPAGQTLLTNAVDVSTTTTEPNMQNNHAIDTTAVNAAPTIALTKTATPNPVTAGQNINYTMTWSVAGNSLATTVLLSDPIPAKTTFVSVADGGSYNATTNTVTWNLGTQTPGATGQVHFIVKTTTPIANGTVITNTASLDAAETDPVLATAPITVSSGPVLSITKSSNVTTFTNPGLFVAYTITVTNAATAGDTAKNVVLKDVLPTGFTFDDSSTSKTFAAFDLKPGETKTFTVNALVGLVTPGTYTNTATAKGDNTTQVSAAADVQIRVPEVLGVTAEAQLTLIKEVNTKLTNAGKTIRYAVTVENIGNATAVNVTITDKLPKGFTFVDGGKTTKTFTIGDLPAGQKRSINYEVLVGASVKQGDFKNVALAQADNVPAVLADATVSVKKPEVLAATGTGPLDYAIAGLGFILAALGIALFITRRPGENQS